jgi:hypothetical protein
VEAQELCRLISICCVILSFGKAFSLRPRVSPTLCQLFGHHLHACMDGLGGV